MAVNGFAVAALGAGALLVWSSVMNQHVTTAVQDLVLGKQPPAGSEGSPLSDSADDSGSAADAGSAAIPAEGSNPNTGNVALGQMMAAGYGWGSGQEWTALYDLWNRESGWSNTAENPGSGAYGIAQALGHGPTNQYPAGAANPPPAGSSSPSAQISWGLSYIKSTYGDPITAWNHETTAGWY